ncbi:hypothetical protein CORMATOL_02406 [Corynebacterium matruchotii ATCC 33806]|uniref:Uncharacterized protein n=1 Tax=Corynebacterium matruchotii ATCC 33806 TaxID=566549 RepID=C0E5X4_9CORY|nr:hypothetical protein CORMATOL_02406 [Corynebacterium matruchotii ATCC 33806]
MLGKTIITTPITHTDVGSLAATSNYALPLGRNSYPKDLPGR